MSMSPDYKGTDVLMGMRQANFYQTVCTEHKYVEVEMSWNDTDTTSTQKKKYYQCAYCGKIFNDEQITPKNQ